MTHTWEDCADDFIALDAGEGWPFAVLAACSVQLGVGQTDGLKKGPVSVGTAVLTESAKKVSSTSFAVRAKTSQPRITRYLKAWNEAAADGHCKPSSELTPADATTTNLPDVPFFKKDGGYYEATDGIGGGARYNAATLPGKISSGDASKVTNSIAASSDAMTKLIEAAAKGPKVIETVIAEMDDESFEVLSEAITAAVTPAPAVMTSTGVKPAYVPSPAKQKAVYKAADKVAEVKHKEFVQGLIDSAPPKTNHKPDGQISAHQELIQNLMGSDKLWDIEVAIHWLKEMRTAVLAIQGPLAPTDEEYVTEQTGVASDLIAQIITAVEAKKGSTVPDTVPDSWN